MNCLIEEFKREVTKNLEKRTSEGKCNFCGKALNKNEFCDCPSAKKVNRYYKKVFEKLTSYNTHLALNRDINEAVKIVSSTFYIPPLFEGVTFDDYKCECESEENGKKAVANYFNNAIKNFLYGKNLMLVGASGTGKTMLESILCMSLAKKWLFNCQFINAVDLKSEITKCFNSKSQKTVNEVVNRYKTADFLFLDDIDKLTPTEYVREFVYSLVNYRVERQLPIITSANHSLEDLDSQFYGEVIVSRLINNSPVVIFSHKNRRFK